MTVKLLQTLIIINFVLNRFASIQHNNCYWCCHHCHHSQYCTTDCNGEQTQNEITTNIIQYNDLSEISKCPPYFTEKDNFCYIIINTTYPPKCPYEQKATYSDSMHILSESEDVYPIWVPIERGKPVTPNSFNILSWTEPSEKYYEPSFNMVMDNQNGNDCVIVHANNTYQAVPCKNYYNALCAYYVLESQTSSYCSQYFKNSNCLQSDYSTNSKCFCINYNNPRPNTTKAELLYEYQNHVLSNIIDPCAIGLEKGNDDLFYWTNSQLVVNYTFWSVGANCCNKYGLFSKSGWELSATEMENCIIYQEDIEARNNDLFLSYNDSTGNFAVTTFDTGEWVLNYASNNYLIFCFVYGAQNKLVYKVLPLVRDITTENITYTFPKYKKRRYGIYWCEGFKYPSLSIFSSNKIIIKDDTMSEYVITANIAIIPNSLPLEYLQSHLPPILNLQILYFTINELEEEFINYTAHLISDSLEDQFDEINKAYITADYERLNSFDLRYIDQCKQEITLFGNSSLKLTWNKTIADQVAYPEELTLELIIRYCKSDLIMGAYWEPPTIYTNNTTLVLTNLTEHILTLTDTEDKVTYLKLLIHVVEEWCKDFLPIDVYILSGFITVVDIEDFNIIESILKLISSMSMISKDTLVISQNVYNATSKILIKLDLIISKYGDKLNFKENNLVIYTPVHSDSQCSSTLIDENSQTHFIEDVTNIQSESAFSIVKICNVLESPDVNNYILVITDNSLFVDNNNFYYNASKIFKVIVKEGPQPNITITYIMYSHYMSIVTSCGIWINEEINQSGYWYNNLTVFNFKETIFECNFQTSDFISIIIRNYTNDLTKGLQFLEESNENSESKLLNLLEFIKFSEQFDAEDIGYISRILSNTGEYTNILITAEIINSLMSISKQVMNEAEKYYQSSEKILLAIENVAKGISGTEEAFFDNIKMIGFNVTSTDFIGLALEKCTDGNCPITFRNDSNISNFEIFLQLTKTNINELYKSNAKILVSVLSNNIFFNEENTSTTENLSYVVGFTIENYHENLPEPILLTYNITTINPETVCAVWEQNIWQNTSTIKSETEYIYCNIKENSFITITSSENNYNITDDLESILNSSEPPNSKINKLVDASKMYDKLEPIDIYVIAEILKEVSEINDANLTAISIIIDNVMNANPTVMKESQKTYGSTDKILFYVDKIAANYNSSGQFETENKFKIIVFDLSKENVSGLMIENCEISCNLTILPSNFSYSSLVNNKALNTAVEFDQNLLEQLKAAQTENYIPKIIIIFYINKILFNEESRNRNTTTIFGILIPGFQEEFKGGISIYYDTDEQVSDVCAFWNYSVSETNETVDQKGTWKEDPTRKTNVEHLAVCNFDHLTHFALLLANNVDLYNDTFLLNTITDLNCILSAIGIFGIILTSLLFEQWRKNTGNLILLNFSISISIKIIALYLSQLINDNKECLGVTTCVIFGVLLHYSVLSEFCWMLIIAFLQFKRFVEVLGGPPKNILAKSCICGWFLPVIPVVCILSVDWRNYIKSSVGLCYPSDLGLYLGVWLPMIVIIIINIIIFIFIFYNVCRKKTESRETSKNEFLFQWRLAVLLFFLLGLTWMFGFLSLIEGDTASIFAYIFCLSATLQGFIMFLFFIVFNKNTRRLYVNALKMWLYSKNFETV